MLVLIFRNYHLVWVTCAEIFSHSYVAPLLLFETGSPVSQAGF